MASWNIILQYTCPNIRFSIRYFEAVYFSNSFLNIIIHFVINIFSIINPIKATGNAALPVLYVGYYDKDC